MYGTNSCHKEFPSDYSEHNVQFKFLSVPFADQVATKAKENFPNFFRRARRRRTRNGFARLAAKWQRICAGGLAT